MIAVTARTILYLKTFVVAGVLLPIGLHVVASDRMPWWPDTVSMGIAFGVVAVVAVSKARTNQEMNRRLWNALKAVGRQFGPK